MEGAGNANGKEVALTRGNWGQFWGQKGETERERERERETRDLTFLTFDLDARTY